MSPRSYITLGPISQSAIILTSITNVNQAQILTNSMDRKPTFAETALATSDPTFIKSIVSHSSSLSTLHSAKSSPSLSTVAQIASPLCDYEIKDLVL